MPRDDTRDNTGSDGKTWAEWKEELSEAIEELDKACAHARQVIYRLRPLVRPKERSREGEPGDDDRRPTRMPEGRGRDRGRSRE